VTHQQHFNGPLSWWVFIRTLRNITQYTSVVTVLKFLISTPDLRSQSELIDKCYGSISLITFQFVPLAVFLAACSYNTYMYIVFYSVLFYVFWANKDMLLACYVGKWLWRTSVLRRVRSSLHSASRVLCRRFVLLLLSKVFCKSCSQHSTELVTCFL